MTWRGRHRGWGAPVEAPASPPEPTQPTQPTRDRLSIGVSGSPLLTLSEAATYVRRYEGRPKAFYHFARRWNIPVVRVGHQLFFRRAALDRFLEECTGRPASSLPRGGRRT